MQGPVRTLTAVPSYTIPVAREISRSSADADKPATRLEVSQGQQHSNIPYYVKYSFILYKSNFVFKTRRGNVTTLRSGATSAG